MMATAKPRKRPEHLRLKIPPMDVPQLTCDRFKMSYGYDRLTTNTALRLIQEVPLETGCTGNNNFLYADHADLVRYPTLFNYKMSAYKSPDHFYNANYIPGDAGGFTFIACEGPSAKNVINFWRMVVENKASSIVMLCKEEDPYVKPSEAEGAFHLNLRGGRGTCYNYFPHDERSQVMTLDQELRVECIAKNNVQQDDSNCAVERNLLVTLNHSEYFIKHVQVRSFQDHTDKVNKEELSSAFYLMGGYDPRSPVVVHCSAGQERTAAFILYHQTRYALHKYCAFHLCRYLCIMRQSRCKFGHNTNQLTKVVNLAAHEELQIYGSRVESPSHATYPS